MLAVVEAGPSLMEFFRVSGGGERSPGSPPPLEPLLSSNPQTPQNHFQCYGNGGSFATLVVSLAITIIDWRYFAGDIFSVHNVNCTENWCNTFCKCIISNVIEKLSYLKNYNIGTMNKAS